VNAVRQIAYHYQPGESGSSEFAIWHLGASNVTVYSAEGRELKVIPLAVPDHASADEAAQSYRPVDVVNESSNLYPAGAS
jgi:hypothetical protein